MFQKELTGSKFKGHPNYPFMKSASYLSSFTIIVKPVVNFIDVVVFANVVVVFHFKMEFFRTLTSK